jgi:membrane protein YqaA with SNARE-associated domain
VLAWLCLSLCVAFGASVLPVVSIELFVVGLVTSEPSLPWIGIGAAVALGQVLGKLLYYLAARGTIELPPLLHAKLRHEDRPLSPLRQRWRERTKRLRAFLETVRERCRRHPHWMTTTYGVSSLIGLPPYMATAVLAGIARMRPSLFVVLGFLGRFVRFSALAAAPAVFASLLRF